MNQELLRRAITFALQRRADEGKKLELPEYADWYARCPKCKAELRGTIAQLKEHRCGDPENKG